MCVIGDTRREIGRNEWRVERQGRGISREQTSQVSCHASNPRSAGDSESLHSGPGREKERGRSEKKRKNRNNSKQTQREKDREGEALREKQLFYFGGRRLAVRLK